MKNSGIAVTLFCLSLLIHWTPPALNDPIAIIPSIEHLMETLHVETLSPSRVPPQLQAYMSPGEWTTFCTDVKAARKDICQKAVCVELGCVTVCQY